MISLADRITIIEDLLVQAEQNAGSYAADPQGWHARHRAEMAALADRLAAAGIGCILLKTTAGGVFRCAGIRATSTSGEAGAIRNWLARAKDKMA